MNTTDANIMIYACLHLHTMNIENNTLDVCTYYQQYATNVNSTSTWQNASKIKRTDEKFTITSDNGCYILLRVQKARHIIIY